MTINVFSNNAKTTLASGITSSQTSITVAPGTGALFPNPTTGQIFKVTLTNASSSAIYEICNCTSRTGDTLTVIRGQEGTTAQPFLVGDIVGHYDTAGVMTDLVQTEQLQAQTYLFAVATGTANALTATVPSNLTTIPDGMSIVVKSSYANTGATTLNLVLGSTSTGAIPIVTGNNVALVGGEIPSAGYPITLSYSSTYNAWVITDGNLNLTVYAPINSPAFTGTPTAPTPLITDNSTEIATTAYVQNNLANYAPKYNPTFTGTLNAATIVASGDVTAFSDERLKEDWVDIPENFVEKLSKVKNGVFTRKDTGKRQVGASAQGMQAILPESVVEGDYLSLAYGQAGLVSAIELAKEIVKLKKEIAKLKAKK